MKSRCAIVYMNLGPYHLARLRAMAEVLPDVHTIEVAGEQRLYPWRPTRDRLGFTLTTLFPDRPCETVPANAQREAIRTVLSKIDPSAVIVAGYREPAMCEATKWARRHGVPTVLQFVSTYSDHPRCWWKELLKKKIIRRYDAIAATGQREAEYAQQLGVPEDSISQVGNVVDNTHFLQGPASTRGGRGEDSVPPDVPARYFLSAARLSPEKNLHGLLKAYATYHRRGGGAWDLVLLGSGPQEGQLRAMARGLGVPTVHFLGWKSYEDLPYYYARASCFVLPSISEPWGLVVNEAMACGLPVLVSRNCGCVPELCRPGENGYVFDPDSVEELAELMRRVSSSPGQLAAMGQASQRIIASFTPQTWAARLRECISTAERMQ